MDKNILKKLLKESLREILEEEGLLQSLKESKVATKQSPKIVGELNRNAAQEVEDKRKKLTESIQKSRFNSGKFDPFAGTKALTESQASEQGVETGPLRGVNPEDPGVDISSLIQGNNSTWKAILAGKAK